MAFRRSRSYYAHVTATASTHAAAQKKANHATQPVAQPSAQKQQALVHG